MTRVEIQSGRDASLPEALSDTFQVCDGGDARGWCVPVSAPAGEPEPSSEARRG